MELVKKKEIASVASLLRNDEGVEKLLDLLSSIIADEYIEIAKNNKDLFTEITAAPKALRNDERG